MAVRFFNTTKLALSPLVRSFILLLLCCSASAFVHGHTLLDSRVIKPGPVVICGGGNAVHVLASLVSQQRETRVLSIFGDEAERWNKESNASNSVRCINDEASTDIIAAISIVSSEPSAVVPGATLIILSVPAFAHQVYLEAIKPYVSDGVVIGAMPGEGSFDVSLRDVFGDEHMQRIGAVFALETLPWACRILSYAKEVEVLGTKKYVDMFVSPRHKEDDVRQQLQSLIGPLPTLVLTPSPLSITLMNINSVWHPTITFGQFRSWDGKTTFEKAPLFYEGVYEFTEQKLSQLSDEILSIRKELERRWPQLDLSGVRHVREWMKRAYGNDIGDTSTLKRMFHTNKGYLGLKHPMIPSGSNNTELLPNFSSRYMTEDVSFGLVVTRGIAELAAVPTPALDEVVSWCQKMTGKEFLLNGRLQGKNIGETRAPQRYGFHDLEEFMKSQKYI